MSINQNIQPGQQQGKQMQVKVTDEILRGVYANMLQVAHTPEEFVLDFMNLLPPSGIINARVIISPQHMKRIVSALQENLKRYESQFGEIKGGANPEHNFGFRTE